jgi:ABC-2 type transport system ATP-binding protein
MLLGITTPTSGRIVYFGQEFDSHRQQCLQRINYASSFNTLQGRISVQENLLVFAHLYGLKAPGARIKELAAYFEISELLDTRYWDLSAGQKTRVNLIKALLNDPELILMDEPTASLDPDIADPVERPGADPHGRADGVLGSGHRGQDPLPDRAGQERLGGLDPLHQP